MGNPALMQPDPGMGQGAPDESNNPFLAHFQALFQALSDQQQPAPPDPQTQGLRPQDSFVPLPNDPRKVSKQHIEQAGPYVKAWMKRSAEYIKKKVRRWHLFEDLYWNRRLIDQWNKTRVESSSLNRAARRRKQRSKTDWLSKQVVSVAPVVDNYVMAFEGTIFTARDYFVVRPSPKNPTGSIEDNQYPTSRKIQTKLIASSNDLQIRTRLYEFVQDGVIFGTSVAKTPWVEEYETINGYDRITGQPQKRINTIRHGTAIDAINLERFLPDIDAKNGDINRWSGIGDRSEVAYDIIKSRFGTKDRPGPYNLSQADFLNEWPECGENLENADTITLKVDQDARGSISPDKRTYLQVWEWHGKLYYDDTDQPVESVATVITGLNTDDPTTGILVRLQERPILKIGLRPYILWQFTPKSGPLGTGIIEPNLDVIWLLSHAQNQFINAVKLMSVPMVKRKVTAAPKDADDSGDAIYPGKIWEYQNKPEEIEPFAITGVDLSGLLQLIQYLERVLEKRTAVSDATRGLDETRKTATEFSGLIAQSQRPIDAKLSLLKEAALDRFGMIAVAYLQQNIFEDQQVFMKGANGIPTPVPLTTEELRSGDYIVEAALNIQDNAKISKAQTIMQLLPIMDQQATPLLMFDNKRYIRAGLIEALAECLDITESAKVLEDVDEQTKQQLLQMMHPPESQKAAESISINFVDLPPEAQVQVLAQIGIQITPEMATQSQILQGQGTQTPGPGMQPPTGMPGQLLPGTHGGPLGPQNSGLNELMQRIQYNGQAQAPVPPGQRMAA